MSSVIQLNHHEKNTIKQQPCTCTHSATYNHTHKSIQKSHLTFSELKNHFLDTVKIVKECKNNVNN